MTRRAKFWLGAALALMVAAPVAAETPAPSAPTADTVVATVNGSDITLGDMIALRGQLPAQYQSLPDDVLFKGILDQLIQQTMLAQSVEGKLSKRDALALENSQRAFLASTVLSKVEKDAVNDASLKAAYDKKYADFDPGLEYHAAHILVKTEDEAKALKAQIDGGADFAELAKKNSKDGSAARTAAISAGSASA